MTRHSRFDRYIEKFKPDTPPKPVDPTIGEELCKQVLEASKKRIDEVIPVLVNKAVVTIRGSACSFWDQPKKSIVVTILVDFDESTVWKDNG